jgi:hypothetical protein
MIRLLVISLLSLFIFTGCYNKQPKTEILTEHKTKVVMPDDSFYEFIAVPSLDDNIIHKDKDTVINELIEYSVKQQTVIMLYENRTESLIIWRDKMKKLHGDSK